MFCYYRQSKHSFRLGRTKQTELLSLISRWLRVVSEVARHCIGLESPEAAPPRGGVGVDVRSIPVTVPGFGNSRPGWGFDPARTLYFYFPKVRPPFRWSTRGLPSVHAPLVVFRDGFDRRGLLLGIFQETLEGLAEVSAANGEPDEAGNR